MNPMTRALLGKTLLLTLLVLGVMAAGATAGGETPSPEAWMPRPETIVPSEASVPSPKAFASGKAGFVVKVKDIVNPYRVLGVFVMPGETLAVEAIGMARPEAGRFDAEDGSIAQQTAASWRWTAPARSGPYTLRVTDTDTGEAIVLNAFVMTPFNHRDAWLNGYRIGAYQQEPLRGNPIYMPPKGFVEVTPANRDVPVSPHFTLGQFLCKQDGGYPKYLILREPLVLKLEMILQEVNKLGVAASTLHVMSAFRTPHYNRSIGNRTIYSRHLYGDAADIFVDADGDGQMDDLNGDGQVTTDDAEVLAHIVEGKTAQTRYQPFLGGLGLYGPKPHRGPFVHVDVRGQRVRW